MLHRATRGLRFIPHRHIYHRRVQSTTSHRFQRSSMATEADLQKYDPVQVALMGERCILVDENDKVIGHESKKNCHLMTNIRKGMLHRAFSVFIFNSKGELLLQQRASEKITFPDYWTNTCCSHPLYTPDELPEEGQAGVRLAAQRKLEQELGINPKDMPTNGFKFLTRLHYLGESDGEWGEHEVDYILLIQKDVEIKPNPNEVRDVQYMSKENLKKFIETHKEKGLKLTPWFALIAQNFLFKWWDHLDNLESQYDHDTIHHM
eukprot:TRINITY_DN151_c0_g1_i1.p1 TRINITY_DN151_c0_g1~~TRINITY_DN151_c0_g1_i1.p1  ORF type:complete len:263 (-),score=48.63 TRINITY_DN151_c0_g1_i1:28-816(-)